MFWTLQAKTALGDHVTNIGLNRDNVSEVLQIYMEAHCGQTELAPLAESLKTKAFQAHTPSQKASVLAFLVNELSCSRSVVRCAPLPSLALHAYGGSGGGTDAALENGPG